MRRPLGIVASGVAASAAVITVNPLTVVPNDAAPHATNTTGTIAPSANARVIIFAFAGYDGGATYLDSSISTTITGWATALTRTGRSADLAIGFNPIMNVFEGVTGASPSSGTITVDWHNNADGAYGSFAVIEAVSTGSVPAHAQTMATPKCEDDGGGNSETHTTSSLGSAATNGHTCIVSFGAVKDGGGAVTTPSGWTAVGTPGSANYATIAVFVKTDFTGTSVVCPDLGTAVDSSGSALMELTST